MNQNSYTSVNIEPQQSSSTNNYAQDDKKIQNLQAKVNEVSSIMEENIKRIVERGTRLENIENRSDLMSSRADEFRVNAKRVKVCETYGFFQIQQNKAWWTNQKMNIIFLVLILGLGAVVFFSFFQN